MAKDLAPEGARRAKAKPARGSGVLPTSKTVRLGDELTDQLQAMADVRQMSFSAVVRTAVEMYLQREEFAVALSDMEDRVAKELENTRRDTARVAEDLQLLIAIVDQFLRFSLMTTPDIVDKESSVALGHRRYHGFVAELHTAFYTRTKKAKLTQALEDMEGA